MSGPPPFSRVATFDYDLGRWPNVIYLDPTLDNIVGSPFTLSSATEIVRANHQFDTTTRRQMDDFPSFESNETNLTLLNVADSTDYNRKLVYYTPVDAVIDRLTFNIGFGFQVSAYTSGNFRINRVNLTFQTFKAADQLQQQQDIAASVSTTNMTGVDNQIVIFNETYTSPFNLYAGGAFCIQINLDTTEGVGTYQKGIMAAFPYQNTGGLRTYSRSGIQAFCRPNTNMESSAYKPALNAFSGGGIG